MNWVFYGIVAMLWFGLGNAFTKKVLWEISPIKLTFYRNIFTSIFLFLGIVLFNFQINLDRKYIVVAILLWILGYFPLLVFYKAIDKWRIWIISPIASTHFIFTILFSIVFFGEKLTWIQFFSIFIIFFWVILSSINFKDLKNSDILKLSSWVPFALLACFWRWLFFFLSKYPINIIWPILTWFIMEFMIMISAFFHLKMNKEKILLQNKKNMIYIFLIWLFGCIWVLTFNIWITKYSISLISTIVWASPIISIFFSKFIYKEHLKPLQYLAIWIILIWLILISL